MAKRQMPSVELRLSVGEAVLLSNLLGVLRELAGEDLSAAERHVIEDQLGRIKLQLDMLYFRNLKKAPYPI